jgi:hypothetical protein
MEYGDERINSSPLPTQRTLKRRTSLPFQLWRFFWINYRMILMVTKGHH